MILEITEIVRNADGANQARLAHFDEHGMA
jgi:hypothetical protein